MGRQLAPCPPCALQQRVPRGPFLSRAVPARELQTRLLEAFVFSFLLDPPRRAIWNHVHSVT